MYGVTRSFMVPLPPYEVTVNDLIRHLEQTKAEIGGDAKVAFSRAGGTWPLRLTKFRTGELFNSPKDTHRALVLDI
ncbi:hypothetical protein D3C71_451810 [compost metagenome]